jgi:hypothetical protein
VPIVHALIIFYRDWQNILVHFPTTSRHTLGARIDTLVIEISESVFLASFLNTEQKISVLEQTSPKIDSVKFLLRLVWEIKSLNDNKYAHLSTQWQNIGKQLGGWLKHEKK